MQSASAHCDMEIEIINLQLPFFFVVVFFFFKLFDFSSMKLVNMYVSPYVFDESGSIQH